MEALPKLNFTQQTEHLQDTQDLTDLEHNAIYALTKGSNLMSLIWVFSLRSLSDFYFEESFLFPNKL